MASTMGAVPMYQMALFSLGDQMNASLSTPPAPFISQTMQSVIGNTNLIYMAILAAFFLKTRFRQVHYIGGILIVLSCVVGVSNQLQNNDCSPDGLQNGQCLYGYKDANEVYHKLSGIGMLSWYVLLLVSIFPGAVSNVYKQSVLQARDVDVCYATWWSGNFQVIWGFLMIWVMWIPLPGMDAPRPSELFQSIADTWQCFIGNIPQPGDETCAAGEYPAIVWFAVYLFFNLSFNICMLWLTKVMSAMWAQIATILCLDLTNIFSTIPALAGGSATPMGVSGWLATILASVSLWVYNLEAETTATPDAEPERLGLSASIISSARAPLIDQVSKGDERAKEHEHVQQP